MVRIVVRCICMKWVGRFSYMVVAIVDRLRLSFEILCFAVAMRVILTVRGMFMMVMPVTVMVLLGRMLIEKRKLIVRFVSGRENYQRRRLSLVPGGFAAVGQIIE